MEKKLYLLDTDPVLQKLVAPFNLVEYNEMEKAVIRTGSAKEIRVWGNIILTDHEYYAYCHRKNIPFCIVQVPLESKTEAVAWICRNQLLRKALPEEMKRYLIGKMSIAERFLALKKFRKMKQEYSEKELKLARKSVFVTRIRERIGADFSIGFVTVRKYEYYALNLDTIYDFIPDFVESHLAGKLKVSFEKMERLALLPPDKILEESRKLVLEMQFIKQTAGKEQRPHFVTKGKTETAPSISIKDMPAYDPDAQVSSLALTIPSWSSSIKRVTEATDFSKISNAARNRLMRNLTHLCSSIDTIRKAIEEE